MSELITLIEAVDKLVVFQARKIQLCACRGKRSRKIVGLAVFIYVRDEGGELDVILKEVRQTGPLKVKIIERKREVFSKFRSKP